MRSYQCYFYRLNLEEAGRGNYLCRLTFRMFRREDDGVNQESFPREKQMETNDRYYLTGLPSAAPNSQCIELEQIKSERSLKAMEVPKKKKEEPPSVAYYKLYSFADSYDVLLIFLGTMGACMHGVAIPVFFVFFGKLIDAFGKYSNDTETMSKEVSKVCT